MRKIATKQAWQAALFGAEGRVSVNDACQFEFSRHDYQPARDYDGRFGPSEFQHHFHGRLGDLDSKEEYACAVWLDHQAAAGRIIFWVRNLAKRDGAFFLQKADGRFYPDFVCLLPDGRGLAVECQGARGGIAAREDAQLGSRWEILSQGLCAFVVVKGGDLSAMEAKL
jgi:type III restriction enzyme